MASKRKNSLVNNINRRKRAGKSRPKSRSTVAKDAYEQMQQGWPRSAKKASTKRGKKAGKTRWQEKSHSQRLRRQAGHPKNIRWQA